MNTAAASTATHTTPTVLVAVVVVCLVATGACLLASGIFAYYDQIAKALKDATKKAAAKTGAKMELQQDTEGTKGTKGPEPTPADFDGLAKLADAMVKLNPSGRLLIASLGFAAIAAAAASASSIALAVS